MRRIAKTAALCALFALAGCSSASPGSSGSGASTATASSVPDTIVIQNFAFTPASLTVAPGATVTVINKDSTTHTVTSASGSATFDTGDITAGASKTFHAPAKAGSYTYICEIHQYMHGTLVVQ